MLWALAFACAGVRAPVGMPVITHSPSQFLTAFAELPEPALPATARAAFLVAPADFALASESASDNSYMDLEQVTDPHRALAQHGALAQALRADCPVITFPVTVAFSWTYALS